MQGAWGRGDMSPHTWALLMQSPSHQCRMPGAGGTSFLTDGLLLVQSPPSRSWIQDEGTFLLMHGLLLVLSPFHRCRMPGAEGTCLLMHGLLLVQSPFHGCRMRGHPSSQMGCSWHRVPPTNAGCPGQGGHPSSPFSRSSTSSWQASPAWQAFLVVFHSRGSADTFLTISLSPCCSSELVHLGWGERSHSGWLPHATSWDRPPFQDGFPTHRVGAW